MVLYKRKTVQAVPTPVIDDNSQEIWQISQTGEVFKSRKDYDDRMEFYSKKHFSCEITGHMNLTYFEALSSETIHAADVEQAFPEPLKEPVLRKIQFSVVSRIDALVDYLHEHFKSDFYPGEHVTAFLPGGDRVEAVIREKTMFPQLTLPNGDIQRKGFSRYTVKLVNRNDEEAQIDNEHLTRDKKTFTKAMLRSFIKNTVTREPWNGAPWLVKDEYAQKYKISQQVPAHLQRPNTAADRKAAQARRKQGSTSIGAILTNGTPTPVNTPPVEIRPTPKSHKSKNQQAMKMKQLLSGPNDPDSEFNSNAATPMNDSPTPEGNHGILKFKAVTTVAPPAPKPIKYPIEDLALPSPAEGRRRPPLHRLSKLMIVKEGDEKPSEDFSNGIIEDLVSFYLSTWVFLNIYCEPLILDSFTFDDYLQAMFFKSNEAECDMLNEVHCSLLKAIVSEKGVVQCQLPEMHEEDDDEEEEQEEEEEEQEEEEEEDKDGMNGVEGSNKTEVGKAHSDGASDSGSRKSSSKEHKHTADQLFTEEEDTWIKRCQARDFRNGGWQAIVAGLLYQLSMSPMFARDVEPILAHLCPPDEEPTFQSVKSHYSYMDCNLRIMVLHLLARLVHETKAVRNYMEECSEEMTNHRKEKIEHQRERKRLIEELKALEDDRKILLPANTPKSRSPSPSAEGSTAQPSSDSDGDTKMNGVDDDDEEDDEDEEDGEPSSRSIRRGGDRALKRKREESESKASTKEQPSSKVQKTSKEFKKVLKGIETVKSKIFKEEADIQSLDEDLRQADCSRFKKLGTDRFWNTYWWFERNGMPYGGLPSSSTAHAQYAHAMVWVQGPDESSRQGFLVEECELPKKKHKDSDGDIQMNGNGVNGAPKLSVIERQEIEESGTTLMSATDYGYIDKPEELEQLINWLDIKGIREKKLLQNLNQFRDHIAAGMVHRQKYLAGEYKPEEDQDVGNGKGRQSRSRPQIDTSIWRCLAWRNESMIDEHGHTHFEHPQPRAKKGKKAAGGQQKEVPLGRNGKPVSRQGDRYNF